MTRKGQFADRQDEIGARGALVPAPTSEQQPDSQARLADAGKRRNAGGAVDALSDVFSPDLLGRVDGIEKGLQRRKRAGLFGVVAFVVLSAVELAGPVISAIPNIDWKDWPSIVAGAGIVLSFSFVVLVRFWTRESKEPFRYTCSLAPFGAAEPTPGDALPWLRHDLRERLGERIGRLSFLEPEPVAGEDAAEAHIHIAGDYLIRPTTDEADQEVWQYEVTPRVRIGGYGTAETLGHPVKFSLERNGRMNPTQLSEGGDYEKLLERIYFSVATQIYEQIRRDVERKIALLPSRYLRATAYLHEADDYARSNTLDAYDAAQELFGEAMRLYGVRQESTPRRLPRAFHEVRLRVSPGWRGSRWQIMSARAEMGYARMLLYRRILSAYSGRRLNPIFETKPVAESAVRRLDRLARRRRRRSRVDPWLFDARVTFALAWVYLDCPWRAETQLLAARELFPERADLDARHLFARALLAPKLRASLALLRRAVEIDPGLEPAQFELASKTEKLWRQRPLPEETVATMVFTEYQNVLRLDPANVQAWANMGYMRWLLAGEANVQQARMAYQRGREYKQIRLETFVAELDYGLARLTAEAGDWDSAYRHYIAAVAANVGVGVSHNRNAQEFEFISDFMLNRFRQYRQGVVDKLDEADQQEDQEASRRIRDSVRAFVENDFGAACFSAYARTGDNRRLTEARDAFEEAVSRNADYVIPHFNLAVLHQSTGDLEEAQASIEVVGQLEPEWPDGILQQSILRAVVALAAGPDYLRKKRELDRRSASEASAEERVEEAGSAKRAKLVPEAEQPGAGKEVSPIPRRESPIRKRLEFEVNQLKKRISPTKSVDLRHLAPHRWLWARQFPGSAGSDARGWMNALDWSTLRPNDLRWEREFNDLHAAALSISAISAALLEYVGEGAQRQGREKLAERSGRAPRLKRLFEHIDQHFSPDDLDRLDAQRLLWPDDAAGMKKAVIERFGRQLATDPTNWQWLLRLSQEQDLDREQLSRLLDAREDPDIAGATIGWVAGQLARLAAGDDDNEVWETASDAYQRALASSCGGDDAPAEWLVGAARADAALGRSDSAVPALVEIDGGDLKPPPGWRLETIALLVGENGKADGEDTYRRLREWLENSHRVGLRSDPDDADDAAAALLRLAGLRSGIVHRDGEPALDSADLFDTSPVAMPIVVEAGAALFPKEGQSRLARRLFDKDIPAMQARIQERRGVPVPGTLIRLNDSLGPRQVELLLDEVPRATRTLSAGPRSRALRELVDWLEQQLDQELHHFLGIQEQEMLLSEWAISSPEHAELLEDAVSGPDGRLRLRSVLRDLLQDGRSIVDLDRVLESFADANRGQPSPEKLIARVRADLGYGPPTPSAIHDASVFQEAW